MVAARTQELSRSCCFQRQWGKNSTVRRSVTWAFQKSSRKMILLKVTIVSPAGLCTSGHSQAHLLPKTHVVISHKSVSWCRRGKKIQNRKESHFCGTCSQGAESKRRLLAATDRVCCLMLRLVTIWRSCGYTKFAVSEESGLVAGRARGCSCSHHIWGLRGQTSAR